jgi:hypothetical protein
VATIHGALSLTHRAFSLTHGAPVLERLEYQVLRIDAEFVSRQLPLAIEAVRNAL